MTLTGAKRAFGIGETKSQNAVIKVYTVDQLKNALTKIYELPSGIGTIEIAGDIVITEPIKLKRFRLSEDKVHDIIIQGVGGSKLINGNKSINQGYNWNQSGNNAMPVFDFGTQANNGTNTNYLLPNIRYTFRDLIINTETAYPFGAIVATDIANLNNVAYVAESRVAYITFNNIQLYNVWNILGTYSSLNIFTGTSYYENLVVNNLLYLNSSNVEFGLTGFNLNTPLVSISQSSITNIGVWTSTFISNIENTFNINGYVENSNFTSIKARVNINTINNQTAIGGTIIPSNGNLIAGAESIISTRPYGFNYLSTNLPATASGTTVGNSTFFATTNGDYAVGQGNSYGFSTTSGAGKTSTATSFEYVQYLYGTSTSRAEWVLPTTLTYNHYQIDWILTVKERSTGLINNYHFKSHLTIDEAGNGTLVSNSTIHADEQFTTLTDITPTWFPLVKRISFRPYILPGPPGGASTINGVCNIKVTGLGHPNFT